jgi:hypothetical protein
MRPRKLRVWGQNRVKTVRSGTRGASSTRSSSGSSTTEVAAVAGLGPSGADVFIALQLF